jgi:hypothetical protein
MDRAFTPTTLLCPATCGLQFKIVVRDALFLLMIHAQQGAGKTLFVLPAPVDL